ncbi:MAG TPA: toll/interleukin-1 receptor domain-containing protein [Gammaproteobacteria bacterium]|nr:toll/interleukin-1 receptor domain-containing protein [Gammaproteobacteria bacterium]
MELTAHGFRATARTALKIKKTRDFHMPRSMLCYGDAVIITKGFLKGKIGLYDDDDFEDKKNKLIIYFGDMFFCGIYYLISPQDVRMATTDDLLKRREQLNSIISDMALMHEDADYQHKSELLLEYNYVETKISERYINMIRTSSKPLKGFKIFISHSSGDKWFARKLCTDLTDLGLKPWLDENDIKVGESITEKIEVALKKTRYFILVLSKKSIASIWVKREWESIFLREINQKRIILLPVLLEDCEIPSLLANKKYANFSIDYNKGLTELLAGIRS